MDCSDIITRSLTHLLDPITTALKLNDDLHVELHHRLSHSFCLVLSLRPPVWGFSFLSVTVINVFSLTGVFIVPLLKMRHAKHAIIFFIAIAVGTLYSTAILQLLPEV